MTPHHSEAVRLEAEIEAALVKVIAQRSARLAQDAGKHLGVLICKIVEVGANDPAIGLREGCDWAAAQVTRRLCEMGDQARLDVDLTRELVGNVIAAFWTAIAPVLEPADGKPKARAVAADLLGAKRSLTAAEVDQVMVGLAADHAHTWADATFRSLLAALRGSEASSADRAWMTDVAGAVMLNLVRDTDHLADSMETTREGRRDLIEARAAAFVARFDELAAVVLG